MSSSIPIRMPGKPSFPRPLKPSKKQSPPSLKRMHIHPKPNPRQVLHSSTLPTGKRQPMKKLGREEIFPAPQPPLRF